MLLSPAFLVSSMCLHGSSEPRTVAATTWGFLQWGVSKEILLTVVDFFSELYYTCCFAFWIGWRSRSRPS